MAGIGNRAPVRIAGLEIAPGSHATAMLPVPELFMRNGASMPVHVFHGKRPGPSLFVSGAVHGDEIIGVEIVRRLVRLKRLHNLRGTLFAVPVVNIYGFMMNSRYLPDRRDLNRFFPGSEKGSLASRLAGVFMEEVVVRCTHGIDLHCGSNHRVNLPHVRGDMADDECNGMARAFTAPVVIDSPGVDGSLRQAAMERGIKVLLYEGGEALRFDGMVINAGIRGVVAVMEHLGMLPVSRRRRLGELHVARSTSWCRAPVSGLFNCVVKLGQHVEEQQLLGTVADPFSAQEHPVYPEMEGIIIGKQTLPSIYKGDALLHIAHFDRPGRAEAAVEQFRDSMENSPSFVPEFVPDPVQDQPF